MSPNRLRYHESSGDRPMSAGQIAIVGLICFLVGALLNADSLGALADRQPVGWKRDSARLAVAPLRGLSHVTGLSKPHELIRDAAGKGPIQRKQPKSGISVTPTTVAAEAPPPTVAVRTPTPAKKLNVWIGGDSLTQVFGQSFVSKADATGVMDATLDYRISSGLTRPDYFDWPAHLQNDVLPTKPEVMVIMFGANDSQGILVDGDPFQPDSPQFEAEYRKRVGQTMDLLAGDGRLVVWVGLPVMRSSSFDARMQALDTIYREEAKKRPWVRYLPTRELFLQDGAYSDYLTDSSGNKEQARKSDGIHFTRFGGDRLADAALKVIQDEISHK